MLIREGEPITALHLAKLEAQSKLYPRSRAVMVFLGIFFCLALLWMVFINWPASPCGTFPPRLRDLAFLAALLLISALLNKFSWSWRPLSPGTCRWWAKTWFICCPWACRAIFAAMFLGLETGVGMAFLNATFTALMVPRPFPLFLYLRHRRPGGGLGGARTAAAAAP